MELSHRERVLTTLDGREPDRVPVDLGGQAWSVVDAPPHGYRGLCNYLGLKDVSVARRVGSYVVYPTDERILRYFDIDFRHVRMEEPKRELPDETVEDCYGVRWRPTPSRVMYYPIDPPLRGAKSVKDIEDYAKWPNVKDPAFLKGRGKEAKRLSEETDYALVVDLGVARNIFHRYAQLRGFDQWFMDMKLNPELYCALTEKIFEVNSDLIEAFLNETGDYADIVCVSDDMGSQASPFLSVKGYCKYVKPWFERRIKSIHKLAPRVRVLYHCCGSVYQLIPEFVDCGVQILNPIQPQARDMEPERLKRNFGKKLCFHGGIDIQKLLPFSKPEEVKEQVKRILGTMAPGGGYILAPSHHIQGDIPPENVNTMYTTPLEHIKHL